MKLCGPPATAAACMPLVAHSMLNQLPLAVTASLKLTSMLALVATFVAPFVGTVLVTVGGMSPPGQSLATPGVLGRRTRSALFWSVSVPSAQRERLSAGPVAGVSVPALVPSV